MLLSHYSQKARGSERGVAGRAYVVSVRVPNAAVAPREGKCILFGNSGERSRSEAMGCGTREVREGGRVPPDSEGMLKKVEMRGIGECGEKF